MPVGGVSPAIPLGVAVSAPRARRGGLADDIDPSTGELRSLGGADPIDAAVAFQLGLRRASGAAVTDDGHALADIAKNDGGAPARIRFELERVLRPLVERGDIAVDRIDVEAGEAAGDLGAAFVHYRNLRRGGATRTARAR